MKLNVAERLNLMGLLAGYTGSLSQVRAISALRQELQIGEEERDVLNLRVLEGGRVQWDGDKDEAVDVAVTTATVDAVQLLFQRLDEAATLSVDHLPLYERFADVWGQASNGHIGGEHGTDIS
jgi:hypothetical protein